MTRGIVSAHFDLPCREPAAATTATAATLVSPAIGVVCVLACRGSAPTAYVLFCKDEREKAAASGGLCKGRGEAMKILGKAWSNASPAVKQKCVLLPSVACGQAVGRPLVCSQHSPYACAHASLMHVVVFYVGMYRPSFCGGVPSGTRLKRRGSRRSSSATRQLLRPKLSDAAVA